MAETETDRERRYRDGLDLGRGLRDAMAGDGAPANATAAIMTGGAISAFKWCAIGMALLVTVSGALYLMAPLLERSGEIFGFRNPSVGPALSLRAAEILLRLAAVSVLLALIAHTSSPLLAFFGFLVIGGLIMPSQDIIRFASFVSPQDEAQVQAERPLEADRYLPQQIIKVSTGEGRTYSRLAHQAAHEVERMIRDAESGRRPSERDGDVALLDPDALRRTLHVLQEDQRAFDAAREIVARGARDLWIGLFNEEAQELSLLWGSDGRHRADLSYFRARGIAEYPYENIESAKLTRFGRSLLRYMDVDAAELPDAGDAFDAGVLGGESLPYSQEFTTGPDGTAIDFEIPERDQIGRASCRER